MSPVVTPLLLFLAEVRRDTRKSVTLLVWGRLLNEFDTDSTFIKDPERLVLESSFWGGKLPAAFGDVS